MGGMNSQRELPAARLRIRVINQRDAPVAKHQSPGKRRTGKTSSKNERRSWDHADMMHSSLSGDVHVRPFIRC